MGAAPPSRPALGRIALLDLEAALGQQLGEGDLPRRHTEDAGDGLDGIDDYVGRSRLQLLGGELQQPAARLPARHRGDVADVHRRPAPARDQRVADAGGVGNPDVDQLERPAEPVGEHLGRHRAMALALRRRADVEAGPAVGGDHQPGGLEAEAGGLGADDDARAVDEPRARRRPPDPRGYGLQLGGEVAAVVDVDGPLDGERHPVWRDLIPAPDLDPVEPGRVGEAVDQPFDHVVTDRPAAAADGGGRHRVGEEGPVLERHGRHRVLRQEVGDDRRRLDESHRWIAAGLLVDRTAQRQDPALGVGGELGGDGDAMRVIGGLEVLAARRGPGDRAAETLGGERDEGLLAIGGGLGAEPAADVLGDDLDMPDLEREQPGQRPADGEHGLGRRGDADAATGRRPRRHGARFHGAAADAGEVDVEANDVGGGGEGGDGVAVVNATALDEVALGRGVDALGGTAPRRLEVDDGKRIELEVDERGRVGGRERRLREHGRERLAHVAGGFPGEDRPPVGRQLCRDELIHDEGALEVGGGPDGDDAGHLAGGGGVYRRDPAVPERAADDRHVEAAGRAYVAGVAAPAGQEVGVLQPPDRAADVRLRAHPARSRPPRSRSGSPSPATAWRRSTRLMYAWRGCSALKPMPPWTWSALRTTVRASPAAYS